MKGNKFIWLCIAFVFAWSPSAYAATNSCYDQESCTKALKDLQNKYNQKQKAINSTKVTANGYQQAIQGLQTQLVGTERRITDTQDHIATTDEQIESLTTSIDKDSNHLEALRVIIHHDIVSMYEMSQKSTVETFFGYPTFGEFFRDYQDMQTVQQDIQQKIQEIEQLKQEMEGKKSQLQENKTSLERLTDTLQGNKEDLSSQKQQVNTLLNSTQSELNSYVAQQRKIQQDIADTQKKLTQLINEAHWGNDIVSAPLASWSYNQLNYPQTLGNSPYTIHDYGCLVTSMAMVATYYQNAITPPQIAANPRYFTRGGYAFVDSLVSGIGLSIVQHTGVNWAAVDDELQQGHPVVVSIYLPQVGAINSDGSSHFIVLQGKSGDTYLMQDPLGANRSYDLKYVRSMYILHTK